MERAQSYGRITAELSRLFAGWPADAAEPPSVLVPGAGLARLCLEIVNLVGGGSALCAALCLVCHAVAVVCHVQHYQYVPLRHPAQQVCFGLACFMPRLPHVPMP